MDPSFHPVVNGIFLLLGILLLVSSTLQFVYGTKKNYALAFLCLITSLWFFRRFFWDAMANYRFVYFLLGGTIEVFIAPLVYFHVKMKRTVITTKEVLKHLALPILIYVGFLVLAFLFNEFYRSISRECTYGLTWYVFICFLLYFTWSFKELNRHIKPFVIPKVYKTVFWFLVIYTIPFTFNLLISIVSLGILWYSPEGSTFLRQTVNGTWIFYMDWNLLKPLLFIRAIFLVFYGFVEIPFFKSLFYPKEIMYDKRVIEGNSDLEEKLHQYLNEEKRYTNKDLTIEDCCRDIGCSKKELNDYLKVYKNLTFTAYLNEFRISEFKGLINSKENAIYDINSIAQMAGFNSRATFYRVFKELEGITPTQYKNAIKDERPK